MNALLALPHLICKVLYCGLCPVATFTRPELYQGIKRLLWSMHLGCCIGSRVVKFSLVLSAVRLSHRTQAEAFDAWCAFVEERQLSLQRLQTALGHWNKAALTAALSAWQDYAQHAQQQREVLSRAMQHLCNRTQATAFQQWRDVTRRKSENTAKAKMCLQVCTVPQQICAVSASSAAINPHPTLALRLNYTVCHTVHLRIHSNLTKHYNFTLHVCQSHPRYVAGTSGMTVAHASWTAPAILSTVGCTAIRKQHLAHLVHCACASIKLPVSSKKHSMVTWLGIVTLASQKLHVILEC